MDIIIESGVKYTALILIIYFLIKAIIDDKIDNTKIIMLSVLIMIPVFLMEWSSPCRNKSVREGYQVTDPPLVPSIYPGPPNKDRVLGTVAYPPPYPGSYINAINQDVEDQKSIAGINMKVYDELIAEENRAKDKIRAAYTNEMIFTETNPINTVPLGTQLYGYTYLPPENWFRAYNKPPVCLIEKNEKMAVVRPIDEGAYIQDLLEFDTYNNTPSPSLK